MKRYLVFFGEDYYPIGGMNDFKGHVDTIEEAFTLLQNAMISFCDEYNYNPIEDIKNLDSWFDNGIWGHIYDSTEEKNVWTTDEE